MVGKKKKKKKRWVKKPEHELLIWSSGSVRCDCAGWVAARAVTRQACLQLFRAERACLRLAGDRELN